MREFFIKQIYLALLAIIFCLPLVQMQFKLFKEKPLNGFEETVSIPKLKVSALLDRSFQQGIEKWFSQKFGLRAFYIRCNNQIYYSVFGQTPPDSTIEVGKNRELLEKVYIHHFLSITPPATLEDMKKYVAEIRKAQDLITAKGKVFLLLISPSKAAFYPEYIPKYYHPQKRTKSAAYSQLIKALDAEDVNYIDGPLVLREAQKTDKNALMFPRGGTHWNWLGVHHVTREILKNVQAKTRKKMMPFKVKERKSSNKPLGSDKDLALLLNLLWPPIHYTVPEVVYENSGKTQYFRPKLLFSGGSFNWLAIEILRKIDYFQTIDKFYYYSHHYHYDRHGGQEDMGKIDPANWPVKMADMDVIILEMNESVMTGMEIIRDLIKNK